MRETKCLAFFAVALLLASHAFAQAPVITAGGVVNAASYTPAAVPGSGVAAGGYVAIFGSNLAAGLTLAPAGVLPLPTALNGTSVTIGGKQAPLFFVAPGQINAQVPWGVSPGSVPVVVTTAAGSSAPVSVTAVRNSPGLFSMKGSGRGVAIAQNIYSATDLRVNDFSVAAAPSGNMVMYGTGLGPVKNQPTDGNASTGIASTVDAVTVWVGGKAVTPQYAGLAPYLVGVYQINFAVPADVTQGCFVPLQIQVGNAFSNTVTLSLSSSGDCSTTQSVAFLPLGGTSYGYATLSRVNMVMDGPFTLPAIANFRATFAKVASQTVSVKDAPWPPMNGGCIVTTGLGDSPAFGDYLDTSSVTALDAGTLTLTPANGSAMTLAATSKGVYSQSLNTFTPGDWGLRGAGGADVGAFGPVTLSIPILFNVTKFGDNNSVVSRSQALTSTWTCPDTSSNSLVSLMAISYDETKKLYGLAMCSAACTAGTITVPASTLSQLPPSPATGGMLMLMYVPDYTKAPKITATGLNSGYFGYSDVSTKAGLTIQ